MCGYLLKARAASGKRGWADRLSARIDRAFRNSSGAMNVRCVAACARGPSRSCSAPSSSAGIYFLYTTSDSELAPQEDQGVIILLPTSAPDATLQQKLLFGDQVQSILDSAPGRRPDLPGRESEPVDRGHDAEAVGSTKDVRNRDPAADAEPAQSGRRPGKSPPSSHRRFPGRRACRSSSC